MAPRETPTTPFFGAVINREAGCATITSTSRKGILLTSQKRSRLYEQVLERATQTCGPDFDKRVVGSRDLFVSAAAPVSFPSLRGVLQPSRQRSSRSRSDSRKVGRL